MGSLLRTSRCVTVNATRRPFGDTRTSLTLFTWSMSSGVQHRSDAAPMRNTSAMPIRMEQTLSHGPGWPAFPLFEPLQLLGQRVQLVHMLRPRIALKPDQQKIAGANFAQFRGLHRSPIQRGGP